MPPSSPKLLLAIKEERTIFPSTIKNLNYEVSVLKRADYNNKLGRGNYVIRKGKWKGMPLYSLTLEERKTCPSDCFHYSDCYGNNMYLAHRFKSGKKLERKIKKELNELFERYDRVAIRLHILGDFYSVHYTLYWKSLLALYPGLHIFGYTARIKGAIYEEIQRLNVGYPSRFIIRYSSNRSFNKVRKYHRYAVTSNFGGDSIVCPEQTGKVKSCIECNLCFSKSFTKSIKFLTH